MRSSQLIRNPRKKIFRKIKKKALQGCPQKRGVVTKVFRTDPKKPNSANRPCIKVRLSNGIEVTAYLPGEKSVISEHNVVLIRGGRVKDLPGIKYKAIRGARDLPGTLNRSAARSLYGNKKK